MSDKYMFALLLMFALLHMFVILPFAVFVFHIYCKDVLPNEKSAKKDPGDTSKREENGRGMVGLPVNESQESTIDICIVYSLDKSEGRSLTKRNDLANKLKNKKYNVFDDEPINEGSMKSVLCNRIADSQIVIILVRDKNCFLNCGTGFKTELDYISTTNFVSGKSIMLCSYNEEKPIEKAINELKKENKEDKKNMLNMLENIDKKISNYLYNTKIDELANKIDCAYKKESIN